MANLNRPGRANLSRPRSSWPRGHQNVVIRSVVDNIRGLMLRSTLGAKGAYVQMERGHLCLGSRSTRFKPMWQCTNPDDELEHQSWQQEHLCTVHHVRKLTQRMRSQLEDWA
jgi:hypothetical protein